MTARSDEPVQEFFSIGEVCTLTDLKPHVLRYWESQFRFLSPTKTRAGNRAYQRREIEMILLVKQLLYAERYTIDGARQKLEEMKRGGTLRAAGRAALGVDTVGELERGLKDILDLVTVDSPPKA
ncbi:MAG TPA: MerR family transcriptional regulator [Gemmatimonadaceae bacterium]|nr:MerR family transcriptional regulator [Gemmatimonadaceae bacterium]